jgi:hypothetical protein
MEHNQKLTNHLLYFFNFLNNSFKIKNKIFKNINIFKIHDDLLKYQWQDTYSKINKKINQE